MRLFNFKNGILMLVFMICGTTVLGQVSFTASSTSGCAPFSVSFTNTSAPGSYTWDLGNGNTSTNFNANAVYNTPGQYTVVLTGSGGATASTTITVYQKPSAAFSVPDDTICTNGSVAFNSTSTPGSGNITLYIWSFGDGSIDSSFTPNINHTYAISGSFTTNLVIIDENNCQSQSTNFSIFAIQRPTASFTLNPTGSCTAPVTVNFTNTSTPSAAYSYRWDFGDPASGANNTSTLTNPSHQYSTSGSYNIGMVVSLGGCSDSTGTTFTARPLDADFNISEDTICVGDQVAFRDTSSPTPSSWLWNFGDAGSGNNTSTLANPSHAYNAPGSYTVLLTVTLGSCTDTISKRIFVRQRPTVSFATTTDSTNCQPPFNVSFTGNSPSTIASWSWNYGDGQTGTGQSSTHTYNAYGIFSVFLTVTDIFGCSNTFSKLNHVQIVRPTLIIPTPQDSGCVGSTFNFIANATFGPGDTIQTFTWNFGDGTGNIAGGLNQSHTFNTTGIFDVSATLQTRDGCTVTVTLPAQIKIGNKPVANFGWTPSVMCYGDTVFFTDSSTVPAPGVLTGWAWDFGSNDQNPIHVFPDTGLYSVTLIVYSNGCSDTLSRQDIITIHPPKPIFTTVYDCANPLTVQFIDQSHGDTWLKWDFGDGSPTDSTNNQNPTHTYPGRGSYTVTLTAYNNIYNCQKDLPSEIRVTIPDANITTAPRAGCYPFTPGVSAATSQDAFTYAWNFGDPGSGSLNFSAAQDTVHTFVNAGAYLVNLTITDIHGCQNSDTITLFANGPVANFSANDLAGCRAFTTNFTSNITTFGANISSYDWNFNFPGVNDLQTTTSPTLSHTFTSSGLFSVQLIVTDGNGCRDTLVRNNYINVTFPDANLNAIDTFVCDNTPVPLTVSMNGTGPFSVLWSFGDGTSDSTQTNISGTSSTLFHVYPNNNTINTLSVTVTDANGCDTTVTRQVRILAPVPNFNVTAADSCGYTVGSFQSNSTTFINQWNWSIFGPFNYNGISALPNPQFQYTTPGWYGGTLTVTNPGCTRTYTEDSLFLVPGPLAFFTYLPDTGCSPITINFNSTIVNGSYDFIRWDFGDGTTAETQSPGTSITYTYYQDGTYFPRALIAYTTSGRQCLVNDTNLTGADIIVNTLLSVDATPDLISTASGSRDTLSAVVTDPGNNPPYTYLWNAGPGTGQFDPIGGVGSLVQYTAGNNNDYVVVTVRDNNGCQAYDTIFVELKPCDTSLDSIPNVFTPDNDGRNDTYYITNLCTTDNFRIVIYNRWGKIIYESDDPFFRWDGRTTGGTEASDGTYYYILTLKSKELHGWIELIRNNKK